MRRLRSDGKVDKIEDTGPCSFKKVGGQIEWRNEEVKIIDSVDCYISEYMYNLMSALQKKFTHLEFSIFGKITLDESEKTLRLQDEYFVPEQIVSAASVDYKEEAPEEFNCVIHKHPRGVTRFSTTDWTYINQNFDYSLLWVDGEFKLGHVRTKTPFGLITIPLEIYQEYTLIEIPEEFLQKINRRPRSEFRKQVDYRTREMNQRIIDNTDLFKGFTGFDNIFDNKPGAELEMDDNDLSSIVGIESSELRDFSENPSLDELEQFENKQKGNAGLLSREEINRLKKGQE